MYDKSIVPDRDRLGDDGVIQEPTADEFFSALYDYDGSALIELRFLPSRQQLFVPSNDQSRRREVLRGTSEDCYFGVATRRSSASGTSENCAFLPGLFADIDFKDSPDAGARAALFAFPLPPSIVVNSGGGLHAYWLFREPFALDAAEDREVMEGLLRRLAAAVAADRNSTDVARILRVPGTVNHKYTPVRPVQLEFLDGSRRYNPFEFDEFLPVDPKAAPRRTSVVPTGAVAEGSRNAHLASLAGSMRQRGMSEAAMLVALETENKLVCAPPLDDAEVAGIARSIARYRPADSAATAKDLPAATAPVVEDTAAWSGGPIDRAALLTDVEQFIRRYVVLTPAESTVITLWVQMTHAIEAFDCVPYLHITSPLPECGKTRTLEVLEALVRRPWLTGRVTAAVLMRKVDAEEPVLLLDESDAAFHAEQEYAEALRGMLNSGYARTGKASACVGVGAGIRYQDFKTFGPKAIAGIGHLPRTVESRSIPIALKRRTKAETVEKWRRRDARGRSEPCRQQLAALQPEAIETLRAARPEMPTGLSDRAEDVLEPLLAIADWVGSDWPERARRGAVALMGDAARQAQEADQSIGLELLEDIRLVFLNRNWPTKLASREIIDRLVAMDDAPWATFTKGERLTGRKLAGLLRGFAIEPPRKMRRSGEEPFRGYELAAFEDAFDRYLPSKLEQAEHVNLSGPELAESEVEQASGVPLSKTTTSSTDPGSVPPVPLQEPDPGAGGGAEDGNHREGARPRRL